LMHFFIEVGRLFRRSVLLQPGVARISNDLQQPCTRVSPVKLAEEAISAQRCLLDYVVRIWTIAEHPSSQICGAVQMWQHHLLKTNSVLRV
jgi:hypothetical protein